MSRYWVVRVIQKMRSMCLGEWKVSNCTCGECFYIDFAKYADLRILDVFCYNTTMSSYHIRNVRVLAHMECIIPTCSPSIFLQHRLFFSCLDALRVVREGVAHRTKPIRVSPRMHTFWPCAIHCVAFNMSLLYAPPDG